MKCWVELEVEVAHEQGEVTGVWLNGSFFFDDLEITEYLTDLAIEQITTQVHEQIKAQAELDLSAREDWADSPRQLQLDEQEAGI